MKPPVLSSLIRLASSLPKGDENRKAILRMAQEMQSELAADADPASKNQNKPETYYGLPPKGVQG